MAASSYYQLDDMAPSDSHASSTLYSGDAFHNEPYKASTQSLNHYPQHTANAYNNAPLHPIDPPSKPLVQATTIPGRKPLKPPPSTSDNRLHQRRYQRWRRYLRILKFASLSITVLLSTTVFGLMIYVQITFQRTKNTERGGRTPWPKEPKSWPTFMLLAGAGLTLILAVFTLFVYCCNWKKAQRSWKLTIVRYIIHIGVWLVISILYRYEKSLHGVDNDLWGWSCANGAKKIQGEFSGVVDFDRLCGSQSTSSYASYVEVVVKILFAVGHFVIYKKTREDEKQRLADGIGDSMSDFVQTI